MRTGLSIGELHVAKPEARTHNQVTIGPATNTQHATKRLDLESQIFAAFLQISRCPGVRFRIDVIAHEIDNEHAELWSRGETQFAGAGEVRQVFQAFLNELVETCFER